MIREIVPTCYLAIVPTNVMEEEIQRTRKYNEAKHFREKIFKRAVEYHGGYVEYHGG